jgi:hypothetical protein
MKRLGRDLELQSHSPFWIAEGTAHLPWAALGESGRFAARMEGVDDARSGIPLKATQLAGHSQGDNSSRALFEIPDIEKRPARSRRWDRPRLWSRLSRL